jgi:hypothetical protein
LKTPESQDREGCADHEVKSLRDDAKKQARDWRSYGAVTSVVQSASSPSRAQAGADRFGLIVFDQPCKDEGSSLMLAHPTNHPT